jgi:conjugative relaxase-like TrwC/TraI family protein
VQRASGRPVLNIGRMAPGRADYYLTAVAKRDGVEGYYLARGEEPGRWLGHGADTLGLSGEVTAEQLRAVLDARHPTSGEQLSAHPARKVPGFDHTFRAPKSVSLLWALGDRVTAAEVTAAHDAAVDAAIGYLQRAAGFTRRGAGGAETVPVDGFVAAAFRHRTSRADDPLLHTHVLVANLARTTDDGVWRTLDSRKLFAHAKTAGVLYQAQLRWELTRRLGVAWQPVVNGHADIDGVDRELIETFSRRRAQIVEHMASRGETSASAAQTATLATRQAKGERSTEAELRGSWTHRAREVGVRPGWHRRLLARATPRTPELAGLAGELIDDEAITARSSSFTRRDLLQAVAERLPTGLPVSLVERLADKVLDHHPDLLVELGPTRGQLTHVDVIRRADGRIVAADHGERRYTTRGLLLTEQRAINRALHRNVDGIATVDGRHVEVAVRRRTLTREQQAMVRRLTGSGAGVEVVVGKAGTGKTYALDAAREVWEAAGIRVAGVALAARAALELEATAQIRSTTLARLHGRLDDHRHGSPLQPGSVLVVDEAGMVGTRELARLLDHAETQSVKVVLVGDPKQLPEIDAGGLFRALTTRLPAIELSDNHRQQHVWEQAALDELRHGELDTALAAYRTHGRIHTGYTAEQVRQQLVDDWWATAKGDLAGSIMIGLRRSDVADLNHRARAKMLTARRLTGPALHTGEHELRAGDRIVCLRNAPRLGVINGTRATITHIDPTSRSIEAVDDRGLQLTLPADYLDAGHLTHGYAITGHKAQGLTCEHTYTLGTETLYREWGYVAMSRGRLTNQLYHGPTGSDDLDGLHHHVHHDDQVPDLVSRLRRSRAQQPITPEIAQLASQWRATLRYLASKAVQQQPHVHAEHRRTLQERAAVVRRIDGLERQQARTVGPALRRHARARRAALAAELERQRDRLRRIDHTLEQLDQRLARLPTGQQIATARTRLHELDTQLRHHSRIRAAHLAADPPPYLQAALGHRPPGRADRDRWERAGTAIEDHRLRWHITDPHYPLGAEPADQLQREQRQRVLAVIDGFQHEQQQDRAPVRSRSLGISRAR